MADKPKTPKTPKTSTTPMNSKVIWLSPQGQVEIDMTPGVPLPEGFAKFVGDALGDVFGPKLVEELHADRHADTDAVPEDESVASTDNDDPT